MRLVASGHEVVVLTRGSSGPSGDPGPRRVHWDPLTRGPWTREIDGAAAVVNLVGESIAGLWTPSKRRRIIESRVVAGAALADAIRDTAACPVLIQASAVGFYGDRGDEELDEGSSKGEGFLPDVTEAWEASTVAVGERGVRRVVLRMGVVLGPGGFLPRATLPFRVFVGGRLGSGRQWLPWVHRDDVVHAIEFLLRREYLEGVFNVVAPKAVTNGEFTAALAARLGRPALFSVPAPVLRLGGAMAKELLLVSQRVFPRRLVQAGFTFHYSNIRIALSSLM
jgi:hypothetical protein